MDASDKGILEILYVSCVIFLVIFFYICYVHVPVKLSSLLSFFAQIFFHLLILCIMAYWIAASMYLLFLSNIHTFANFTKISGNVQVRMIKKKTFFPRKLLANDNTVVSLMSCYLYYQYDVYKNITELSKRIPLGCARATRVRLITRQRRHPAVNQTGPSTIA